MITQITATLYYKEWGIGLSKICDFPSFPPPDLIIADWTDNEVIISDHLNPVEQFYDISESKLYISSERYFDDLEKFNKEMKAYLLAQWQIEDMRCFERFTNEFNPKIKS